MFFGSIQNFGITVERVSKYKIKTRYGTLLSLLKHGAKHFVVLLSFFRSMIIILSDYDTNHKIGNRVLTV